VSRKSYHTVTEALQEAEHAKHSYLRSHGWQYTSNTPGCIWLWQKSTSDGRVLLVDTDLAVSMQSHSCAIRGNKW
jgi:hypothetical protein